MRGDNKLYKNEFGALIIRIVLGSIFLIHGLAKFQEGIAETIKRFESYNIPYADYVSFGVAGVELIGGFFLIIGFSVRFVSALLIIIMTGAIVFVKFDAGFLNGYEYDVALLAMSSYLLFGGSRLLALDKLFVGNPKKKSKVEFRRSY